MSVYSFAGFFGKDSDAPTNSAQQEEYIRYTLARLSPYSNVLLNVEGPEPTLFMTTSEVSALGNKSPTSMSTATLYPHTTSRQ